MTWEIETWAAAVSAGTAVASLIMMFSQRAVDKHHGKALLEGVGLLRNAAQGYRDEVAGIRGEIEGLRHQVAQVNQRKVAVDEQRERRLDNDRKWKAALEVLDRLS
jgi:uncharacterized membrane protein YgaE (UPF0421/DUF939 family)